MIPQRAKICIAGVSEDPKNYGLSLRGSDIPKYAVPKTIFIDHDRVITTTSTLQDLEIRTLPTDFDSYDAEVEL